MTVSRCLDCGAKQATRSRFELECSECGGELAEEDAYDPPPEQLRCSACGYVIDGADPNVDGADRRSVDDAPRLSVEDPCPRCRGDLVPFDAPASAIGGRKATTPSAPETNLARLAARKLLKEHWNNQLPVDVAQLASAMGVPVVEGDFDHQGLFQDGVIQIPRNEAAVARRFGIAHELGHFELRHKVNEPRNEREANAFASELLVPRDRLKIAVREGLGLRELYQLFDVSREAMLYALSDAWLLSSVRT